MQMRNWKRQSFLLPPSSLPAQAGNPAAPKQLCSVAKIVNRRTGTGSPAYAGDDESQFIAALAMELLTIDVRPSP